MSESTPRSPSSNGILVLEFLRVDVGVELLEHLAGDVVVERGGRVRQEQPGTRRRRPHDHEELVVDVEQSEHGSRTTQFAQFSLRGGQAVQRGTAHRRATPFAVLAHDRYAESVGMIAAWPFAGARCAPMWANGSPDARALTSNHDQA